MATVNGLRDVVAAETEISHVDGENGRLLYRGLSVADIARSKTFEEVAYFLWEGSWPDETRLTAFSKELVRHRFVRPEVLRVVDQLDPDMDMMSVLRTAVSAMGSQPTWPPSTDEAIRLTAAVPTLIAYRQATLQGNKPVEPHPDLSHVANYLYMLEGGNFAAIEQVRAMDRYFVLTAEHGLNASTFAARVVTSTQSDMTSAISAAIGAMKGPLHGGAPSEVLNMLEEIGDLTRAEGWLRAELAAGRRIMGFGHRVYKTDDPRAVGLRSLANELAGRDTWLDLARGVESAALGLLAQYKPGRGLYTNVEYWASAVFRACHIPQSLFTPTFTASRMVGWTAHILEQAANNCLIRPRSVYVGANANAEQTVGVMTTNSDRPQGLPAAINPSPGQGLQVKDQIKKQFGQNAASYVTSEVHAKGADLQTLVTWLRPSLSWVVLDVATGGGHVAKTLSPLVASVVASDLTEQMLLTARSHVQQSGCANVSYVLADSESLPFLNETFDAVTCRIAAHHFPQVERFVREAFRVLKKGGKLLIIDNIVPEDRQLADFQNTVEKLRDPSHVRCLTAGEWSTVLAQHGFRIVQKHIFAKVLDFYPWLERMGTSSTHALEVERFMTGASPRIKGHFQVVEEAGTVQSWSQETLILMADKSF